MSWTRSLHLVLRHDQVLGREENLINSSVTQIDLHDFSRLACTYQLGGFHCVTPLESQHKICHDILSYWREGYGQTYNPDRNQALSGLALHRSFDEVLESVTPIVDERRLKSDNHPIIVGTSARKVLPEKEVAFEDFSSKIGRSGRSVLIQFGTAWGLSPHQLDRCDWILPPVDGLSGYNHLSVRCAAAIIIDRIVHARQN